MKAHNQRKNKTTRTQGFAAYSLRNTLEMDHHIHQMEKLLSSPMLPHLQRTSPHFDEKPYERVDVHKQCHLGVRQLLQIVESLQVESKGSADDSSISGDLFLRQLSANMSECLSDYPRQKRRIGKIQSLLKDYRVVQFHSPGSCSVSLSRLHLLVQENYEYSSLTSVLNIIMGIHPDMYIVRKIVVFD